MAIDGHGAFVSMAKICSVGLVSSTAKADETQSCTSDGLTKMVPSQRSHHNVMSVGLANIDGSDRVWELISC